MFSIYLRRLRALGLFLTVMGNPASADECRLVQLASLDVEQSPYGLLVSASLDGSEQKMLLDTGSPLSVIDPKTAADLHLTTHRIFQGAMFNSSGEQFTGLAQINALKIGNMQTGSVRMLIYPSRLTPDDRIAGLLGANFLRHYDLELDLAENKLNLFEQDHCPGKVVYWKADAAAVLPFKVEQSGHIVVPVKLDGVSLDALLDTGATNTILTQAAARQYFDLKPSSPEMVRLDDTYYRRTFGMLDLDGLAISHPAVLVRTDDMGYAMKQRPETGTRLSSAGESNGLTPLVLGMNEMKHFRLFISYKEQKLYLTPAPPSHSAGPKDVVPAPVGSGSK